MKCLKKVGEIMDTKKLQEMLDKRGDVYIADGNYTISDTLLIHDNTKLTLAHNAVLKLAENSNCVMLQNSLCSVGINRHITVSGGTWDGNNAAQEKGKPDSKPYFMGNLMRFIGIEDLCIHDVCIKDPERYAMQIMNADRFTVENITFDYNMLKNCMDGVHVQGSAKNGYIRNIKGATNDDLVALNCDDYHDDGEKRICTKGDIENITVDGIYAENGYTAVRLLSCSSKMRNISIRNVFGSYRCNGISFTHHSIFPNAPVWFDNIDISNVYCTKPHGEVEQKYIDGLDNIYGKGTYESALKTYPILWFAKGVKCGSVSLSNIHRDEHAITQAPTIQIDRDVEIEKLTLANIDQRFHSCDEVPLLVNNGKVVLMKNEC